MLNVPDSVKALWMADENPQIRRNLRVQFPNGELPDVNGDQIVAGSFKFVETIMSHSTFKYGSVEAPTIEFMTMGVANMLGMTIFCRMEIETSTLTAAQIAEIQAETWDGELVLEAESDIGYGFFAIPLGYFVVDQCPRDHGLMTRRRVRAYGFTAGSDDADIYNFDRWRAGLWFQGGVVNEYTFRPYAWAFASAGIKFRNVTYSETEETVEGAYNWHYGDTIYSAIETDEAASTSTTMSIQIMYAYVPGATTRAVEDIFELSNEPMPEDEIRDYIEGVMAESVASQLTDEDAEGAIAAISGAIATMTAARDPEFYLEYGSKEAADESTFEIARRQLGFRDIGKRFYVPRLCVPSDGGSTEDLWTSTVYLPVKIRTRITKFVAGNTETHDYINSVYANNATAVIKRHRVTGYNLPIEMTAEKTLGGITRRSYSGKFPLAKTMNALLESSGWFGRQSRTGVFEALKLNNSNPFVYSTGSYSECWFDEYNLSPVGTIIYSYTDPDKGAQQGTYAFGSGKSIYDISGNVVLEGIAHSAAGAESWLRRDFIPNIDDLNFTPVELTGKAFPWVEAGDAIEIITEDGEVVESYVLERTMSGLMALTDSIYSSGGDLAEVEIDV